MDRNEKILKLSVLAGETLLYNGAEIFRVQETMMRISEAFQAEDFHVYVVSNGIFASARVKGETHSTHIRQVSLSPVHLGRVAAMNQLSREISGGKYTIDEAFDEVNRIKDMPYKPLPLQTLASGVGSASFCYILGGSFFDSIAAFISGLILYLFIPYFQKKEMSKIIRNILGSTIATLSGLILFQLGMGEHIDKIIIGAIIPLVPGVPITTAIRDFMNTDYLSGTIRLIDALLVAFCIAIGVGFVLKLWGAITGVAI